MSKPPILEPAPVTLSKPCIPPMRLPERSLTQADVEEMWLRDRVALIECRLTKEALMAYYVARDTLIRGAPADN